jgi:hypothetical protein
MRITTHVRAQLTRGLNVLENMDDDVFYLFFRNKKKPPLSSLVSGITGCLEMIFEMIFGMIFEMSIAIVKEGIAHSNNEDTLEPLF